METGDMNGATSGKGSRFNAGVITVIGLFLMLGGVCAAFAGPVEIYCFYLFSEGGRFHYQGFGVGSFMFANLAA